jgi:hypothetical protein
MTNAAGLVAVCPHCGESVEILITKKQVKELLKAFSMPRVEGMKHFEQMESKNRVNHAKEVG